MLLDDELIFKSECDCGALFTRQLFIQKREIDRIGMMNWFRPVGTRIHLHLILSILYRAKVYEKIDSLQSINLRLYLAFSPAGFKYEEYIFLILSTIIKHSNLEVVMLLLPDGGRERFISPHP